ncbi:MAG: glucose 1-dehydrogenase [Candidatus Poribacteria bacterium]|nr:glucose 1-dehydrogenase [Candidatus Poribacteria bacterium]
MPDFSHFDLTGRNALVTGGSKGLGHGIAVGLARAGATVAVLARTESTVETAVSALQKFGGEAHGFIGDVGSVASIREVFAQVRETFDGRLDILVNAAGVNVRVPTLDYTEEQYDMVLDVNLKGTFFCCQEAGRLMIPQKYGRIINIGSLTSAVGMGTLSPYGASKMGVVSIMKQLAVEWGPHNINVNGIAPGWFETDLNRKALFERPGWRDMLLDRMPLGRSGDPEDLADVAVFLASDAARYVTGQMIYVDGGFLSGWHAGLVPKA